MEHTYKYIPPSEPPVHQYTLGLSEQERLDLIQIVRAGRDGMWGSLLPAVKQCQKTSDNMLKVLGVNP